jgi:pimeloyl-ACP methyl ester carboxylesterase
LTNLLAVGFSFGKTAPKSHAGGLSMEAARFGLIRQEGAGDDFKYSAFFEGDDLMFRFKWLVLIALVLLVVVSCFLPLAHPVTAASAPPVSQPGSVPAARLACDPDGLQESGAVYRLCVPIFPPWNGDLVVFAHGYVSPTEPVGIPEEQMTLPGGITLADVANSLGYAFATTSYSTNGLAVREGVADLVDLVDIFTAQKGAPDTVYLVGGSEGGLITALAVEQYPDVFDGGLAMCGPYGDFARQINYFGDFRVVFDYFFPGLLPDSPIDIPGWLLEDWDTYYETTIKPEIEDPANTALVEQLLSVTKAPYDTEDASTKEATIQALLWYNVFSTNDGLDKLGGQPFGNQDRVYAGSDDDVQLNQGVQRFSADQAALDEIAAHYQTTGHLSVPLVTLHTTGDQLVPYWHVALYRGKTVAADNIALHEHLEADRYGHCDFTFTELLYAFYRLVDMVDNPPPYQPVKRAFLPLVVAVR